MKKILLIAAVSYVIVGCNVNPNKEERLQKLETEMEKTNERISELERRLEEK